MKIPLGGGAYLEPDDGPRDSRWHKKIVRVEPIPYTQHGNWIDLECGHRFRASGDLAHANGVVLCMQCRDLEQEGK